VAGATSAPTDRFRNKLERSYALHLDALVYAGQIRSWSYESVSFRLGEGAKFTPDFLVVLPDDVLQVRELKGHMREAARVRWLVAKERYPMFQWIMVRREHGQWTERKV
jgi:hypothetical protein